MRVRLTPSRGARPVQTHPNASREITAFVKSCHASCSRAWEGQSGLVKWVELISNTGISTVSIRALRPTDAIANLDISNSSTI